MRFVIFTQPGLPKTFLLILILRLNFHSILIFSSNENSLSNLNMIDKKIRTKTIDESLQHIYLTSPHTDTLSLSIPCIHLMHQ